MPWQQRRSGLIKDAADGLDIILESIFAQAEIPGCFFCSFSTETSPFVAVYEQLSHSRHSSRRRSIAAGLDSLTVLLHTKPPRRSSALHANTVLTPIRVTCTPEGFVEDRNLPRVLKQPSELDLHCMCRLTHSSGSEG